LFWVSVGELKPKIRLDRRVGYFYTLAVSHREAPRFIHFIPQGRASEDEVMRGLIDDCSLTRFVDASEAAGAAVFLASDGSSAVTDHTLVASCGKHMMH
jgi:NAD(P)-dependent dehydrogenase (short-subunit alcohol dehydrogenase family)